MNHHMKGLIEEISKFDASIALISKFNKEDSSITITATFLDSGRKFRMTANKEQVYEIYHTELGIDKYILGLKENAMTIRILITHRLIKSAPFQQYITARKAVHSSKINAN